MKRFVQRWYGPYAGTQVWKESAHLLADMFVGIALFTVAITMLSLSAGLLITLVGLPLLVLTVAMGRLVSPMERGRARGLLDLELPGFTPLAPQGNLWQRAKAILGDGPGWLGIAYSMTMLWWGTVAFTVVVTIWTVAFSLVTAPAWAWISDPPPPFTIGGTTFRFGGWAIAGGVVLALLLGLMLVALLPRLVHWLANVDRALVRSMLAPSEQEQLERRVSELQESRDASVESAATELRRIERDLHDGAQQRLVSVAMNLGMAKERLSDEDDPRTRELVTQAHDEAKQAIVELRDLVRGIHPAVLTDRGLDAAVSALAARCPVPVQVRSDLSSRVPAACESTAYFVVAEALTNVAKHSRATSATVDLTVREGVLVVTISDDGVGGATEAAAGGLHGLRDRVRAVEGRLRLASPEGGPTTLIAEVPCGS
ncbi:MAG: sensor domain-containing protein [Actinobacteria bacterium]|nr:sensor domain-containing protein [Actinomycetota bacterium]